VSVKYRQEDVGRRIIIRRALSGSPHGHQPEKILDELPIKPPRSRLEPYREFIEELRSRGRTYRDIAEILAEKCAVQVTGSGVHDFVRTRTGKGEAGGESSSDDVQRRIAALKARNTVPEPLSGGFEYNPDEPLRLKQSGRD
jgi:hypothetical protein